MFVEKLGWTQADQAALVTAGQPAPTAPAQPPIAGPAAPPGMVCLLRSTALIDKLLLSTAYILSRASAFCVGNSLVSAQCLP
jgi:hypothetical protein